MGLALGPIILGSHVFERNTGTVVLGVVVT